MDNNNKPIELPLRLAFRYLSYQPRTIYEMRKYIKEKGFNDDIVTKTIELLVKKNHLNDDDFAKLFVASKIRYKPKSKFAFCYELKKKGVNSSIIDIALKQYEDKDLAIKSVRTKIKMWQNLSPDKFKKKMFNFLRYRGFDFDICISTLNHYRSQKKKMNNVESIT